MVIVFVIGIELFEFDFINFLWDIVQVFDGMQVDDVVIVVWQLLCVFGFVNEILVNVIEEMLFMLVFVFGLVMG